MNVSSGYEPHSNNYFPSQDNNTGPTFSAYTHIFTFTFLEVGGRLYRVSPYTGEAWVVENYKWIPVEELKGE